jgi:4-amino-4-deoxy-L-arabinose transferase-like glycosyltransferase
MDRDPGHRTMWQRVAAATLTADRLLRTRWEAIALVVVLIGAAVLRGYNLDSLPYGITGDEASSGLEARRILTDGWIGPYSPLSLGQPAGTFYLDAMSFGIFGESVTTLRLVSAVAGSLTVLAIYVLARRSFGRAAPAIAAAGILAVSSWHIHFSRMAVPLPTWPLVALLATVATIEAIRSRKAVWWVLAGVFAALGSYVYDANSAFVIVLGLFLLGWGLIDRRRTAAAGIAMSAVAFLLTLTPLIWYAAAHRSAYLAHTRYAWVFDKEEWTSLRGLDDHISFVLGRYVDFWDNLCCHPTIDGIDGTGSAPLAPPVLLVVAGMGVAAFLVRRRCAVLCLAMLALLLMPFASVFTEGAMARRAFLVLPFIALFAAFAVAEVAALSSRHTNITKLGAGVAIAFALTYVASEDLRAYFGRFAGSETERWVFGRELYDANTFMREIPSSDYVYFFSERWSFDYETRKFLAPAASGIDRSAEFGTYSLAVGRDRHPVFVLLGRYKRVVADIRLRYPAGREIVGGSGRVPTFIAYVPDAG